MAFKHYNHLNVPDSWERYFTKYPQGMSILESLFEWVSQVDNMVDNQNNLNDNVSQFRNEIDAFIGRFDERLQTEVTNTLTDWQASGFLEFIINEALQTEMDDLQALMQQFRTTINTQVTDVKKVTDNNKYLGTETYGLLDLPNDFNHAIDFNIWKNRKGEWEHDYKIDNDNYTTRYVSLYGSSNNDGLTRETPWGSMSNTFLQCEASAETNFRIVIIGDRNRRQNLGYTGNLSKSYKIESEIPLGTNQETTFTAYAGSTFRTPMEYEPTAVYRLDEKGVMGLPKKYTLAVTLEKCLATNNTYFWENNLLYVNKPNTTNLNTMCVVNQTLWQFTLTGSNNHVILDGLTLLAGGIGQNCYVTTDAGLKGKFYAINCKADFKPRENVTTNGVYTDNVKDVKLIDCVGFGAARDLFNYHSTKTGGGMVLELNCFGENAGELDTSTNNNISTAHDGIHILRVGLKGRKSKGPLVMDVGGCYSICYDCSLSETRLTGQSVNNAAFVFTDEPSNTAPNPNGKALLIDCEGGSETEYGINGYGPFKNKIMVRNFKGKNFPEDLVLTVI